MEQTQKYIYLFLKLLLAAALLLLLTHYAQFKPDLLIQIFSHPVFLFSIISIFILQAILASWRWSILNTDQQVHLDFLSTSIATYIGAAFNSILPGAVGGDIVRWFYLIKKIPDKKSVMLFSVFLDRVLGFIGVFIIIALVIPSRMHAVSHNERLYYTLLMLALACASILILFTGMIIISGKFQFAKFIRTRLPNYKWSNHAALFLTELQSYHISKKSIGKCLLISVLIQIIMAITIKLIAEMMGFADITLIDYIIASSLTMVVNLIPATPGGVGIGEMAFANILILLNPHITAAYATIYFAYRIICTLAYLPGVILFIPRIMALRQTRATA